MRHSWQLHPSPQPPPVKGGGANCKYQTDNADPTTYFSKTLGEIFCRIWQLLEAWSVRALSLGYLHVLDREAYEACCAGAAGRSEREARLPVEFPTPKKEERETYAVAAS